ncbi:MAG TPA: ATP-dependent Clp protease adaptor ClpS [Bacteroidales bacterium]|nr:ATP-dependent Clp protease adaptor ClpS [Bacteroidales bacterium]
MRSKKELPEKYDFEEEISGRSGVNFLTLHNDDVHTFDYVIETLVDVCEHDSLQAEQCAYIVHYKGKCEVKKGTYDTLHPMKSKLIEKGLAATID